MDRHMLGFWISIGTALFTAFAMIFFVVFTKDEDSDS